MSRLPLLLFALALLHPLPSAAQYFPPDPDLERMLRYAVEDGVAPGVVVGFLEADGSTRVVSHGSAGPGVGSVGPGTIFEIGSVSKTFAATLLADMAARREVALDDPLSKHFPGDVMVPQRDGREITLADLATHRSGLPRMADVGPPPDPDDPHAEYTIDAVLGFLSAHELEREPGARYAYSNLGFQLLSHALARAGGTSYPDLLRARILEPLGMVSTAHHPTEIMAGRRARGHRDGRAVPYWTQTVFGAGGLQSDVTDMLRYLEANVGPPDSPLERAMRRTHGARAASTRSGLDVGLGWHVRELEGRRIVEHGGNTGGFSAMVTFDPEARVGYVRLANTAAYADDTIQELLLHGPPPSLREIALPARALAPFAGEYELAAGSTFCVRVERDGALSGQILRQARFPMYAASDSAFFLKHRPARFAFRRDGDGDVVAVVVEGMEAAHEGRAAKVGDDCPPPRVIMAGNEWSALSFDWALGFRLAGAVVILLALLTLGAEVRRRVAVARSTRG